MIELALERKPRNLSHMNGNNEPKVVRVEIMGEPQITFPFPGQPEINIVARLTTEKEVDQRWVAVVVQGNRQVPGVGSQINVLKFENFYRGRPTSVSGGVSRYCLQ